MNPEPSPVGGRTVAAVPLRVLHLLATLDEGGTERLVLTLCRALGRRGCHTEVAVLAGAAPLTGAFQAAGIPVHHLGLRAKVAPWAYLRLRRLIRAGGYHLVHTHLDLADLYGPFAVARGTPVVSTRHNTDPWRARRDWKRLPFLVWERAAQRRTAATIAVSRAVRDFLVRVEGLDPARFVIIPNGIDLHDYETLPDRDRARQDLEALLAARGEAPLPAGRRLVGFVGRLAPQKGVDVLLEALRLTGGRLGLVLVGDGPLAGMLRHRASSQGLEECVRFAGASDRIATILPAFDLFAFPSRWEGFGLAAVEAMAAGLPVVAAAADGLREVIEDGITGRLVPPEDAAALAEALVELSEQPARAAALGHAARCRAFERFSAQRMAAEVFDLYRRVLVPDSLSSPADRPLSSRTGAGR